MNSSSRRRRFAALFTAIAMSATAVACTPRPDTGEDVLEDFFGALAAGDAEAGASVHLVTPELDGGPILGQARVPVLAGDDADTLAARVLVQEHRLYPAVLRRFAAGDRTRLDL